uniref:Uncharacterized protein n=1 Tax=Tanacetum cinerariifolium TaxID=118510 RepID=A0A699QPS3_TANCI|nr:hypothetical protein [Tanacetum cinerariifolium]
MTWRAPWAWSGPAAGWQLRLWAYGARAATAYDVLPGAVGHRGAIYGAGDDVHLHAAARWRSTERASVSALFLAQHDCAVGVVLYPRAGPTPIPGR